MAVQDDSTAVAYVYENVGPVAGGWVVGKVTYDPNDRTAVAYVYEDVS
jgi:hypothetical protein